MQPEIGQKIRSVCPDLLDWENLEVQTIKDPSAPLSVVSSLGVIHAGVEEGSAIHRLRALECHEEWGQVLDVLEKYFGLPLARQ